MINGNPFKLSISQGNQQRFRQLMELTSDELLLFAVGFVKQKEIAEEIVSDVYVKIWKNRSEIVNIINLKSYLFICVRNGCLSHLRKEKGDKTISLESLGDFHFIPVADSDHSQIEIETIEKIYSAIDLLPPKCKLAFTLAKINGMKYREIAEVMEVSEKTVNNHLVNAVQKIMECLNISKKDKNRNINSHP
jgi:RNA polymerase sigma-70 factor (ECF subfamily)